MMQIQKRNGDVVNYDMTKIVNAVMAAMRETEEVNKSDILYEEGQYNGGEDMEIAVEVANKAYEKLLTRGDMRVDLPYSIDEVQETVQHYLAKLAPEAAERYIIYKEGRAARHHDRPYTLIDDEFVSKYKHLPMPMAQLGAFVYYRTYSRWLEDEKRREYWWETVRRTVEYNCSLEPGTTKEEAQELYDNVFNLRQFLSGRTMWIGSTEIADKHPMGNYNCAHEVIARFEAFRNIFYLSMVGSGVGVNVRRKFVDRLPEIRSDFEVIHMAYEEKQKSKRTDHTSVEFMDDSTVTITIGDSKEGWIESLEHFFEILSSFKYRSVKSIRFCYDNVRPKGEKLKTFGGTASGHESLLKMYKGIEKVIKRASARDSRLNVKLEPIDCVDIANIIGQNVVSGGVRRTAQIILCDADDKAVINAKMELYSKVDGQWVPNKDILHRQMSNNSIIHAEKPAREDFHKQIEAMRYSGEPGWVNEEAALLRNPHFCGVNPCGEILLDEKGLCNLTTINWMAFVVDVVPEGHAFMKGSTGKFLDVTAATRAFVLGTRSCVRMTLVTLEMPDWDEIQQRDRLLGVSFTGWQDMLNAVGLGRDHKIELLTEMRYQVHEAGNGYANELNVSEPILMTTVKPEGTLSQLPTVSSGVHFSHSEYFIRRVRISADDPLVKVAEKLDWPVFPEVGQDWDTCTTKVVEFPVHSAPGKTKYDIGAIEQLEEYLMMMEHYVDHNCSITIHVRDNEWDLVEEFVWEHWDDVVAVSFLSLDDNFYELLPYDQIDKEEYDRRVAEMKPFVPSLISEFEKEETILDIGNDGCETGHCPVR